MVDLSEPQAVLDLHILQSFVEFQTCNTKLTFCKKESLKLHYWLLINAE